MFHTMERAERELTSAFRSVRQRTVDLAAPLTPEDQQLQSMPDASPTKWHLAHTSWFFETFLLRPKLEGYREFHPDFGFLFNSYYEAVGARFERRHRGLLSRPGLEEIHRYRAHVDEAMAALLSQPLPPDVGALVTLGLHHEEQHQELILTDLKHALAQNPLWPVYRAATPDRAGTPPPLQFLTFPGGVHEVGHPGGGFAFDNEGPLHRVFLEPFRMGSRLVTCGEYHAFIEDGGYRRPELWLSEGWDVVGREGWTAPLYWLRRDGQWAQFTLSGLRPIDPAEPVTHVSYFEADAYARWAQARLPTEAEWEVAAAALGEKAFLDGGFLDGGRCHPQAATRGGLSQLFGEVWQWTQSAYSPYPGFHAAAGAVGEYNGKFMVNQYVLRGASCATPRRHARLTYRNFFATHARWQFSGVRLAKDGV